MLLSKENSKIHSAHCSGDTMDMKKGKKVAVALSGGVDSAVTAALLLKEGYDVLGLTMTIGQGKADPVAEGKKVAEDLRIPHYVVDVEKDFQKIVIENFVSEYKEGRTPNPCVICNKEVKFKRLLEEAKKLGASYLATGHYVRLQYNRETHEYEMLKAVDASKDQTYMLYRLTQEELKHLLFPLGKYTKEEVRALAKLFGIKAAEKPDSQENCFIPDDDYKRFLSERISIQEGNFVDKEGHILGKHQGIPYYTIGQRKGLGISGNEPFYVIDIRPDTNEVVLGSNFDTFSKGLIVKNVNYISALEQNQNEWGMLPKKADVKIRHSVKTIPASLIRMDGNRVKVMFSSPGRAVTKGQSCVFYEEDKLLGGGIISERIVETGEEK